MTVSTGPRNAIFARGTGAAAIDPDLSSPPRSAPAHRLPDTDAAAPWPQTGPGQAGIADRARDDMHVELAHDVAERADVDLVRPGVSLEEARRASRLLDQ